MFHELSDTQIAQRPGVIELGLGHPDPTLLALVPISRAVERAVAQFGPEMLNYGFGLGPGPLRSWLAERIAVREGVRPAENEIAVTGGVSHMLDHLATLLLRPGDAVLAQAPTYHLALRIFRDHGVALVPVASDAEGISVIALQDAIHATRARGLRPRLLYAVPTFNNPTGQSWSAARRSDVIAIAAREGMQIVEDDAYRELCYDGAAAPALWSIAPRGVVIRLGSFSKSLAAGLRVGWLTADSSLIKQIAGSGVLDSGGGPNQFAAMCVTAFCTDGNAYDLQLAQLTAAYRERRDALAGALATYLPDCAFISPAGGFFLWLQLPENIAAADLQTRALAHGISFLSGSRFFADGNGGANALRLCFALYAPEILIEGVRRIALAKAEILST